VGYSETLKACGKQRTAPTCIQAVIRNLNQLELVGETLRYALNALAVSAPEGPKVHVPQAWYEQHRPR
jgi:transposase